MKKDTIVGIVFVIWFIASLMCVVVFMNQPGSQWFGLGIMGHIFLIFYMLFTSSLLEDMSENAKKNRRDFLLMIFPLIGIGLIVGNYIEAYSHKDVLKSNERSILYAVLGMVAITGFFFLSIYFVDMNKRKKQVSGFSKVNAQCIDILEKYEVKGGKGESSYCPVYSFYFMGNDYEVCDQIYSDKMRVERYSYYDLCINPKNPQEFYTQEPMGVLQIISLIVGIFIIFLPILGIIFL